MRGISNINISNNEFKIIVEQNGTVQLIAASGNVLDMLKKVGKENFASNVIIPELNKNTGLKFSYDKDSVDAGLNFKLDLQYLADKISGETTKNDASLSERQIKYLKSLVMEEIRSLLPEDDHMSYNNLTDGNEVNKREFWNILLNQVKNEKSKKFIISISDNDIETLPSGRSDESNDVHVEDLIVKVGPFDLILDMTVSLNVTDDDFSNAATYDVSRFEIHSGQVSIDANGVSYQSELTNKELSALEKYTVVEY